MQKYVVGDDLTRILKSFGLVEIAKEREREKGKMEFAKSKLSRKKIYFDYINIRVSKNKVFHDSAITLSPEELNVLIFYLLADTKDFEQITGHDNFSFKGTIEGLNSLRKRYKTLQRVDVNRRAQTKLERILRLYDSIDETRVYNASN